MRLLGYADCLAGRTEALVASFRPNAPRYNPGWSWMRPSIIWSGRPVALSANRKFKLCICFGFPASLPFVVRYCLTVFVFGFFSVGFGWAFSVVDLPQSWLTEGYLKG